MPNLCETKKTIKIINSVSTGTDVAAVSSSAIDCSAANRVCLELILGAATNAGKITYSISECATSDGTFEDIEEVVHTFGASDEADHIHQLDVPITKRYVKVNYQRETQNSEIDSAILSLYDLKKVPSELDATVKVRTLV